MYNVSTAKKSPHRRFHEWAEAHGHAQAREAVIIGNPEAGGVRYEGRLKCCAEILSLLPWPGRASSLLPGVTER